MKSNCAKINYVLLLVFLICGVGMLIVNAKINSMDDITNEISQNYIASVSEVDTISGECYQPQITDDGVSACW